MSPNLSREEVLAVLHSMGIEFPPDAILSRKELLRRFEQALDHSQQISTVLSDTTASNPVDGQKLAMWSPEDYVMISFAAIRGTGPEIFGHMLTEEKKRSDAPEEEIFMEMRKTIVCTTIWHSNGGKQLFWMDESRERGIFVEILQLFKLENRTQLHIIAYRVVTPTLEMPVPQIYDLFGPPERRGLCTASRLEQRLLLEYFELNAKRLHPRYQELLDGVSLKVPPQVQGLKASFLLPLGPISMRSMATLTRDLICSVYGKKGAKRCTQCLSASYCGKECQKGDWKNHKGTCHSVKAGSWRRFAFEIPDFKCLIGRRDGVSLASGLAPDPLFQTGEPPLDAHKHEIFLAKYQRSLNRPGELTENIMIYDERQSFKVVWKREAGTDLFEEVVGLMEDKHKCYRWTRRVGDFSFEVCLDRAPTFNPQW